MMCLLEKLSVDSMKIHFVMYHTTPSLVGDS